MTVKKWHSPVQRAVISGSVDMSHWPASASDYLGILGKPPVFWSLLVRISKVSVVPDGLIEVPFTMILYTVILCVL